MNDTIEIAKTSAKGSFHLFWGVVLSSIISALGVIVLVNVLLPEEYGRMKKLTVETLLTSSEHDVISAQGSIYFKTFSLHLLQKLLYYVRKGKKLCLIGLPCQISALKRVLRNYESKLYFIGLICNHVNEIWYLKYIAKKYLPKNARLIAIGPRKDGWPGGIKMIFKLNKNLREHTISSSNFWGPIPHLNISSPLGCTLCRDHLAYMADIVVGDAWHPKFGKDSSGTSILIVRTTRGLNLVEGLLETDCLYVEETGLRDLLIAQGHHLIEGSRYANFRRKLLQHHFTSLRELKVLEKLVMVLMIIMNKLTTRFEVTRRFLETSLVEKLLKIASFYMYEIRLRILACVVKSMAGKRGK